MNNNQNNNTSQFNNISPYSIYYSGQPQQNSHNYSQQPNQFNTLNNNLNNLPLEQIPNNTQQNNAQSTPANNNVTNNLNSYSNTMPSNIPQQYNQFFNNQTQQEQKYPIQQQNPNYQPQPQIYQQNQGNYQAPLNYNLYNYSQQGGNPQNNQYQNQPVPSLIQNVNNPNGFNQKDYTVLLSDYYKYERNPPEPYKSSIKRVRLLSGICNFGLIIYLIKHTSSSTKPKMRLFGEFLFGSLLIGFMTSSLLMVEYKKAFDYSFANKDFATIRREIDVLRQERVKVL